MKKIFLLFWFCLGAMQGFGQSETVATFAALQTAISNGNGFAGDYTITIQNSFTFTNANTAATGTTALPAVNKTNGKLIIKGDNFTIDRAVGFPIAPVVRFLLISTASTVEIEKLTIKGWALLNDRGAGINNTGTLTLTNCTIENSAISGTIAEGGGLYNAGTATLNNTTIKNNTIQGTGNILGAGICNAAGTTINLNNSIIESNTFGFSTGDLLGGGIYNAGTANITNTTIKLNTVNISANNANGGGIYNIGTCTILRSTIHNNEVGSASIVTNGAGIYHDTGSLTIQYSTISTNSILTGLGSGEGAGIYCGNGNFTLENISVVRNDNQTSTSSGLYAALSGGTIRNSLFLDNTNNDVFYATGLPTMTNNIAASVTGFTPAGFNTSITTSDIIDNVLRDNGGATFTHALVANINNVAIEGGTAIILPTTETDQRGESLLGGNRDIGAYEFGTFYVTNGLNAGVGSLREAITASNFTTTPTPLPDLNGSTPNRTIKFKIPSLTPLCSLTSALPTITKPVIIDGSTQQSFLPLSKKVEIDGTFLTAGNGFTILASAPNTQVYGLSFFRISSGAGIANNANNVTIGGLGNKGNVFQACSSNGVYAANGNNTIIENNYFGLLETGALGTANTSYDIWVGGAGAMTDVIIKNNVLGAMRGGIGFGSSLPTNTVTTTTIEFNRIGFTAGNANITSLTGVGIHTNEGTNGITIQNNAIGNRSNAAGIVVMPRTSSVIIRNNGIGMAGDIAVNYAAAPCQIGIDVRDMITNGITIDGNYIGSAIQDAIKLSSNIYAGANACNIQNNFIGMTPAPYAARPNNNAGIFLGDGTTPISGITLSNNHIGNSLVGIYGNALQNSTISQNKIGLYPLVLPSTVEIAAPNSRGLVIEGTMAASSSLTITNNTISGNTSGLGYGVQIASATTTPFVFTGNKIGTNTAGDTAIPNGTGILIGTGASGLTIGGVAGQENIISGNSVDALIISANNTTVRNNYIGLDINGTALIRNQNGLTITGINITGTVIEDNTISGTAIAGGDAVTLKGIPTSFKRNKIGTDKDGNALILATGVFAIGGRGVLLESLAPTPTPLNIENNVIASCDNSCIRVENSSNISIFNNRIGVNINGSNVGGTLGTNSVGIWSVGTSTNNVRIKGNIISNLVTGVLLDRPAIVENNKIGLDSAGTAALPNSTGISIGSGLSGITIGGANATDGNSFAATDKGIDTASPCIIRNNLFGVQTDRNTLLPPLTLPNNYFAAQAIHLNTGSAGSSVTGNIICQAHNTNSYTIGVAPFLITVAGTADAIKINANNITVDNNRIGITGNGAAGGNDVGITFTLNTAIGDCDISNNIISNNTNVGIYAGCNPSTLGNSIINNHFGMLSSASNSDISTSPSQVAIALDRGAGFSANTFNINDNVINNTSRAGIILQSNNNTLLRNKIGVNGNLIASLNTGIGLIVGGYAVTGGGSNNTIGNASNGNVIANNTQGILIASGAVGNNTGNNNSITNNQIYRNRGQGINIGIGNSNRISQNSIYSNGTAATGFAEKGIDLNLSLPPAQQGNNGQPAPTITNAAITSANSITVTLTVNPLVAGTHTIELFKTANSVPLAQVEGEIYLGSVNQNFTVAGSQSIIITINPTNAPISSTDYITATVTSVITSPVVNINTSEFSTPYLLCSTSITSITTQNTTTTCFGTTADVRINLNTLANALAKFDIDTDGNGTYEYTGVNLQVDAAGKFLLLPAVSGGTAFANTRVFDQTLSCLSPAFANGFTVSNATLPTPIIRAARVVQATSCSTPNARLVVRLQNFVPNSFYTARVGGALPVSATIVGDSLSFSLATVPFGTQLGTTLQVSQAPNCVSAPFAFSALLQAPTQNIDTTLVVSTPNDEISPNFAAQIIVANSRDSIEYSLVLRSTNQTIGNAQQGRNGTNLTFSTGNLTTEGSYTYSIVARHVRTGCSLPLQRTVVIKVFSGIYPEELDILREVYNSTNGNNWDIRWDFSQSFTTFLGVKTFGGRVTEIKLPANNLTGVLTNRTLLLRKLQILDITGNSLDFGSVEAFVSQAFAFTYSNQARINRSIDTTAYTGTSMVLSASSRGTANLYQWQKDGVNISGATSNSLTINPLQNTDAGIYTCIVRNTIGTQLTLTRNTIRLRTITRNVSSTDLTLLIKINESLGGANWTNKWKLDGTVPVAELYGIQMEGDKIKYINLANNNLIGTIPDIIPVGNNILSDLIYLNLSGNQISGMIPATLGNLKKLQYLDLSNNILTGEVIREIGNLPDLVTLWVGNNQFNNLHSNLGNLAKLENFFAQNIKITTVFADWSKLTALKKLNLSNNNLKDLPQSIDKLINLESLELANCQFETLPNVFGNLKKLQELSLQNNKLATLPPSFATLTTLQRMVLHTNLLDFADLEPLQTLPVLNTDGAVYEPQGRIGTAQEVLFTADQSLDISQTINGTANSYQWLKDGLPINTPNLNRIFRSPVAFSDAGVYTLTVKNSLAKRLTLFSQAILVRVSCGNSTSVAIEQAGAAGYCEGEAINTTLTAKALNNVQAVGYQWFKDNARLVNETTSRLSVILSGNYVVHITAADGCVFISQPVALLALAKPKFNLQQQQNRLEVAVTQSKGRVEYAWYLNNQRIVDENSRTFQARQAGEYYVVVTDSLNCPAKSQTVRVTVTSAAEELDKQVAVYPNPTQDFLTIDLPTDFGFQSVKVYNSVGQTLQLPIVNQSPQKLQLNTQHLASGLYQVELRGKKGVVYKKIVKQ